MDEQEKKANAICIYKKGSKGKIEQEKKIGGNESMGTDGLRLKEEEKEGREEGILETGER